MKSLRLQHLVYQNYKPLKAWHPIDKKWDLIQGIDYADEIISFLNSNHNVLLKDTKLALRPLSDYLDINSKASNELDLDVTMLIELNEVANKHRGYWNASYGTIQMMCENHIDFQDLISQGLAIDINTL